MAIRSKYWETVPGTYPEDPPRERLTPAGAEYLIQHQSPPPREAVRADSAGLRMIEHTDDTGRKIREFTLPPGESKRDTWMRPYMDVGQEMVTLNVKNLPKDRFPSEQKYRADQAMKAQVQADIARGVDVRFDLETGERTQ